MKSLLWTWCLLAAAGVLAAPLEVFNLEGQTLTLEPGVTVQQPIKIIRWKHNGNLVVDWNGPDWVKYYGKFEGRTTLDEETLKLEIKDLTLSDGGTFSLETEKGPVNSYEVKVIKNPPKPKAVFKPLVCSNERHCMCVVDPKDLGVVFYQWKMDNGDWFNGTERLNLSVADNPQEVSCKVITRLSHSEASSPTKNDCHKLAPAETATIVVIVIIVLVAAAVGVGVAVFLVWRRPQHPLSQRLRGLMDQCFKKQSDPDQPTPAEGVPLNGELKENSAVHESAAV